MKKIPSIWIVSLLVILTYAVVTPEQVHAGSYDGYDLAVAILANQSTYISSQYWDRDAYGCRQSQVLTSRGNLIPTHGSTYAIFSTGRADLVYPTSNGLIPGGERGNWFVGGQYGNPRDEANLQLQLIVPEYMHYLYYDVQFFTVEYPDYVGTQYNDQLTITVNSPSQGVSSYIINVNGGDFVLNARDTALLGTGYNLFAQDNAPSGVDWLQTTPNSNGADAGATALIGREHPVSPGEIITLTIDLKDEGDNQFDSMAFFDNVRFAGYARTEMLARKTVEDLNGGLVECEDVLEYSVTISNIGTANQNDNPGPEFEDVIPTNTQYLPGSATASSGSISYDGDNNKILWDGGIPAQSSVALHFSVKINPGLFNNTKISNQGVVHWDENENGINEENELTDDPTKDDGIDQDGDGETNDDDPTVVTVWSYEAPTILTEDFAGAEDIVGGRAQNSYFGQVWFETSTRSAKSNFEVSPSYHYSSARSFKTKLRNISGTQYWNYSLSIFNKQLNSWEVWFACGNGSEPADLYLSFKTVSGSEITKIKFEYSFVSNVALSSCYQIKMFVQIPTGWIQLRSDYQNGYLYNGWYKLRIEKNGESSMNYSLSRPSVGVTDEIICQSLGSSLSSLARVEWSSLLNPVVSPIIFWDDHTISLIAMT
ncbi:MAG: choice-of-anchor L domain-containing protein [Candidatus Thermoplasmatota archaeon]|nr:choice-of-anchor L domain-containing protein [Candidatus Thermoplasmatota archaeon]